jgi:glycerate-2-kinase
MTNPSPRAKALQIFQSGLAAANARDVVCKTLRLEQENLWIGAERVLIGPSSRIVVVGAGKASAPMAEAAEEALGARIAAGVVSVKDRHGGHTARIQIREAGHPLPDARSLANGEAIIAAVQGLTAQDVVLCLLSGGASALMESLGTGISLAQLRMITSALMHAGANIVELNCVRKHLSALKGGQLARWAQPASLYALILSDVVGDDLSTIASGPTCPDPSTFSDALDILNRFGADRISEAAAVKAYLQAGTEGRIVETPKADDPLFGRVRNLIVGNNRGAVDAAAQRARELGYSPEIVSTYVQGEAREVGKVFVAIARERVVRGEHRLCLLAGGETTVTVRGGGRGGRNQELAMSAALELDGLYGITLLSAATDGGDGSSDAAGAIVDGTTVSSGRHLGLNARQMLGANDSHHFFADLGAQVTTGPTLTNVNDMLIILID